MTDVLCSVGATVKLTAWAKRFPARGTVGATASPFGFFIASARFARAPVSTTVTSTPSPTALDLPPDLLDIGSTLSDAPPVTIYTGTPRPNEEVFVRVINVTSGWQRVFETNRATVESLTLNLNSWDEATIAFPREHGGDFDFSGAYKFYEVEIYRGTRLLMSGPIINVIMDKDTITCTVVGPLWYTSRRGCGPANGKTNRLTNPGFDAGFAGWEVYEYDGNGGVRGATNVSLDSSVTREPGLAAVATSTVDMDTNDGMIFGLQRFLISGGDTGVVVSFTGHNYVPGSDTNADDEALQLFRMTQASGGTAANLAASIFDEELNTSILETQTSFFSRQPRNFWTKHVVSITVPPGETNYVVARWNGVNGTIRWDRMAMYYREQWEWFNVDQGTIIYELNARLQDAAYGKDTYNLDVIPKFTGVNRDLVTPYSERASGWTYIQQFVSADDGVDMRVLYYPDADANPRLLELINPGGVYYGVVLEMDGNCVDFQYTLSFDQYADAVYVLGDGGDDKDIGVQVSPVIGVLLETTQMPPERVNDIELAAIARQQISTAQRADDIVITTKPLSELEVSGMPSLLDLLRVGDQFRVKIPPRDTEDRMTGAEPRYAELRDDMQVGQLTNLKFQAVQIEYVTDTDQLVIHGSLARKRKVKLDRQVADLRNRTSLLERQSREQKPANRFVTPISNLWNEIGGLQRDVGFLIAGGGGGGASTPIPTFSMPGPIAVSASGRWESRVGNYNIMGGSARLVTAGTSTTIAVVKKNGVTIVTFTLTTGVDRNEQAIAASLLVAETDYITVEVTTAGSNASDLVIELDLVPA